MGPIAYALCQKPVIGLAMFITNLCGFPPLVLHEAVSLSVAGSSTSISISVPVTKPYFFELDFEFPNADAMRQDDIVGSRYDKRSCDAALQNRDAPVGEVPGQGRPIPVLFSVRRKSDHGVVVERTLDSNCVGNIDDSRARKTRYFGGIALPRGEYIMTVMNLEARTGLDGVKTSFSLISGYGK